MKEMDVFDGSRWKMFERGLLGNIPKNKKKPFRC